MTWHAVPIDWATSKTVESFLGQREKIQLYMSYKIRISQPIMAVKVAYDSPFIPLSKKVSWPDMLYELTERQAKPWSHSLGNGKKFNSICPIKFVFLNLSWQSRWHMIALLFLFQKRYHDLTCCTNWLSDKQNRRPDLSDTVETAYKVTGYKVKSLIK